MAVDFVNTFCECFSDWGFIDKNVDSFVHRVYWRSKLLITFLFGSVLKDILHWKATYLFSQDQT